MDSRGTDMDTYIHSLRATEIIKINFNFFYYFPGGNYNSLKLSVSYGTLCIYVYRAYIRI